MRDCQRFFDELKPRLETARMLEYELDAQLARRFNVFDYLRTDELGISRIIADLLNPQGKHGQGTSFLKLLLGGLKSLIASEHLDHASVEIEKTIRDERRIDIYVRIGKCCLAIENKPYTGDQRDQIKDYLGWLKDQKFKNFVLIYLSPQGEPPSPESVKLPYLKTELDADHSFKIMPYHEGHGDAWEDRFDDYRLDYTLTEWLADCRKNCDVDRLRWFLSEAETFFKRTFGGHTMADSESNTAKKFVLASKENWDVALEVGKALPKVKKEVSDCFAKMVLYTYPTEYKYPDDMRIDWNCKPRGKSYMAMCRKSWKSYKFWNKAAIPMQCTQLRLEAQDGVNDWYIGVCSTNEKLTAELQEALGEGRSEKGWPWWKFVDKYRYWDVLIQALHRECQKKDGDVKNYFVNRFAEIAEKAIPIIDRYERT